MELIDSLVPICFFIGSAIVCIKLFETRHRENMALIERGTCTATVTATESLSGWFIERDDFRALVAQRVPGAVRVQHTLTLVLSDKLRDCLAPEARETVGQR